MGHVILVGLPCLIAVAENAPRVFLKEAGLIELSTRKKRQVELGFC